MKSLIKKSIGIIVLFLLVSQHLFSQATSLNVFQEWAKDTGLTNHVYKAKSVLDGSSNVYTVGGTVNANGNYDILVTCYNSMGNLLWTATYDENALDDFGTGISIDESNHLLFITGAVTVDTAQGLDVGIIAYDLSGNFQWSANYDRGQSYPMYNDGGVNITNDGNGYVYITGSSQENTTLTDFITLKYDYSSSFQWARFYDNNNLQDYGGQISYNPGSGNITVAGIQQKNLARHSAIALIYDPSGSMVSSSGLIPNTLDSIDEVHDITFAANGDIYFTGYINHSVTGKDEKIIKMDANLHFIWEYVGTGGGPGEGNVIRVDDINHLVYVAGYVGNGVHENYFLYQLDTAGAFNWYYYYDGPVHGNDRAEAMVLDLDQNPIITGHSNQSGWDNTDYYTTKLDQSGNVMWGINYNGLANNDDNAWEITIDSLNNTYVIGQSEDSSDTNSIWITVKYVEHELFNVPDDDTIPSNFDVTPNWGQLLNADTITNINTTAKYYSTGPAVFFEDTKLMHLFSRIDTSAATNDTLVRVDMVLTSDTTRKVFVQDKWGWYSNFYYPHTAATKGLVNVPAYKKIVYPGIYPNIDMHASANVKGIKEQFVLKQGADPKDIAFVYEGADTVYIDNNDLVIATILDTIRYKRPMASQIDSNGNYVSLLWDPYYTISNDTVFFDSIMGFNGNLPLVIEMNQGSGIYAIAGGGDNLEWSTYYGGMGDDISNDVVIDDKMFNYITGYSTVPYVPLDNGNLIVFTSSLAMGTTNAFLTKFNPNQKLVYSIMYGGNGEDNGISTTQAQGTSVLYTGNYIVFIAGYTTSSDLLDVANSFPDFPDGNGMDGFVVGFTEDGSVIQLDSYIGGDGGNEQILGINANTAGYIAICGYANSGTNFPLINNGYDQSYRGSYDGFIMRWREDADPTNEWCSFYGGYASDGVIDVSINDVGELFALGFTSTDLSSTITSPASSPPAGTNFPICIPSGAYVQSHAGAYDNFLVEFDEANNLVWSTYFGTTQLDFPYVVASEAGIFIGPGTNPDIYITSPVANFIPGGIGGQPFFYPPPSVNSYYQDTTTSGVTSYVAKFINRDLYWFTLFGMPTDTIDTRHSAWRTTDITVSDHGYIFIAGTSDAEVNQLLPNYCTAPTNAEFPFCDFNGNAYMETDIHGNTGEPLDSAGFYRSFIACFDAEGVLSWSTRYGNSRHNIINGIDIYQNDKLFVTGWSGSPTNTDNHFYTLRDLDPSDTIDYFQPNYGLSTHDAVAARFSINDLTIGIEENNIIPINLIYPNPTTDWVYFKLTEDIIFNEYFYNIMDLTGRTINHGTLNGNNPQISLLNLSNGIYMISLNINNRIFTYKVIKQ